MGLFNRKPKVVKEVYGGAWGHLVRDHGVSVDQLSREYRCVDKGGQFNNMPVTFIRVFQPGEAQKSGVEITGWETFDQHPELVCFEGYLDAKNQAKLEKRRS